MSDLTDNWFYPSAERIWLCIRLTNSWKYCDITLEHRKPVRIHWKADAFFFENEQGEAVTVNWRSLSSHVTRIFAHKNRRGGYWQPLVSTGPSYIPHSRSYTRCFARCFWRSHYQQQSFWPSRSYDLTPLDYYLWGAVKDKCYADKPDTIDALKDYIRRTIGEIQLHTIDNVLKNGTM